MYRFFKTNNSPFVLVIFELFKLLGYKISLNTIKEKLLQHPSYPSLFSLTNTLANFKLINKAVQLKPKQLTEIETPFLAITHSNEILLIKDITSKYIKYYSQQKGNSKISHSMFLKFWNRMVILVEVEKIVEEEDYIQKKRKENYNKIRIPIAICFLIVMLGLVGYHINNTHLLSLLLLKIVGISISILLAKKEIIKSTNYSFCSIGDKISCDEVLNSQGAKIFSWLSLTDLGIIYYSGTIFAIMLSVLVPEDVSFSMIIVLIFLSFLSLPYTIFSVLYQGFVIKKWCLLCLGIVLVLWLESTIGFYFWSSMSYSIIKLSYPYFLIGCCLLFFAISWMLLKKPLIRSSNFDFHRYAHLKLINDNTIFEFLQEKQKIISLGLKSREIVLGNTDALNQITIALNPFCPACGNEFINVLKLITQHPKFANLTVRFVGNDNNNEKTLISLLLIEHYFKDPTHFSKKLLFWFKKRNIKDFIKKFPIGQTELSIKVLKNHLEWADNVNISVTPILYFNGKLLSEHYRVENLANLIELNPKYF